MKKYLLVIVILIVFFVLVFSMGLILKVTSVNAAANHNVTSPLPEIEQLKSGTKKQTPPVAFNGTNWDKWMSLCMCIFCCKE